MINPTVEPLAAGGFLLRYRDDTGMMMQHNVYCATREEAEERIKSHART